MRTDRDNRLRLVPAAPEPTSPAPAPLDELPDDELVVLARGGDRDAFTALVRRHQQKVIAFATRFFCQHAVALDVAQEVFLDLLRALPRYRPQGRFHVYLYRVTINRCRMTARRVRYEDRMRDRYFASATSGGEPLAPDEAAARDRQRRLLRAMQSLPEKQRAVVQLRFWSGLSHDEIAEALETREGTVKSRLWHALALLRRQLGTSEDTP